MPEGPELHLASLFVNRSCNAVVFTGPVQKSSVSKCPDVPFTCEAYRITATSRGKEVKLTLTPIKSDETQTVQPMDIIFRFGMSGYFRFTFESDLPKHAHLCFYSNEKPCRVLSYVDARRFGRWQPNGSWQAGRGPCVMLEYKTFRDNVLSHLSDHAFDKPICEVLLNQKYFNGIGNYLRAEILFRSNIPPFVQGRTVLEGLDPVNLLVDENPVKKEKGDIKKTTKKKGKAGHADVLGLCHTVPMEVVNLGGKGYDPAKADYSGFAAWLQCYSVDGMKSLRDHNGRTVWFRGDPGPMAPKGSKSPKAKKRQKKEEKETNKEDDQDYIIKKKVARRRSENTPQKTLAKQETKLATGLKQGKSKLKQQEVDTPREKVTTRRRKINSVDTLGPQRQVRVTRQNSK